MLRSAFLFLPLTLALPAAAQRLIAVDSSRVVSEVDINTGARTALGTLPVATGTSGGLAYDQATGRLFVTSTANDALYTIDVTNWTTTLVGAYGNAAVIMHGLEWDSSTGTLYGMSSHDGGLYTIDSTTGVATLVGTTGLTSFCNLGYDVITDTLWMTNSNTDSFYSISRATGAATLVGALTGPTNPNGLAYCIDNLNLYLVCNNTDTLYTINTATGVASAVGSVGASNLLGLVYIPGNGRITRAVHGCGATTIKVTGHPSIGSTVTTTLGSVASIPFIAYGLNAVGVPFCGCTIGHDAIVIVGSATDSLFIPLIPGLNGATVLMQGVDYLAPGACPDPLARLTDTITVTIGL
jgi:hypothetical protein